jgi:hypothetical protein
MKKSKFGFIVLLVGSLYSCGPSPDDYSTENIKSNCDCLKMRTELMKNANDVLEAESDVTKRKEVQKSDAYKQWTKKKFEIGGFCSKNFKSNLKDDQECPDFEAWKTESKRDKDLYQSEF